MQNETLLPEVKQSLNAMTGWTWEIFKKEGGKSR
jgi:hypothetical protein